MGRPLICIIRCPHRGALGTTNGGRLIRIPSSRPSAAQGTRDAPRVQGAAAVAVHACSGVGGLQNAVPAEGIPAPAPGKSLYSFSPSARKGGVSLEKKEGTLGL